MLQGRDCTFLILESLYDIGTFINEINKFLEPSIKDLLEPSW